MKVEGTCKEKLTTLTLCNDKCSDAKLTKYNAMIF